MTSARYISHVKGHLELEVAEFKEEPPQSKSTIEGKDNFGRQF